MSSLLVVVVAVVVLFLKQLLPCCAAVDVAAVAGLARLWHLFVHLSPALEAKHFD